MPSVGRKLEWTGGIDMSGEGVEHLLMHALRLMKDKMLFALSVTPADCWNSCRRYRNASGRRGNRSGRFSSCALPAALPM